MFCLEWRPPLLLNGQDDPDAAGNLCPEQHLDDTFEGHICTVTATVEYALYKELGGSVEAVRAFLDLTLAGSNAIFEPQVGVSLALANLVVGTDEACYDDAARAAANRPTPLCDPDALRSDPTGLLAWQAQFSDSSDYCLSVLFGRWPLQHSFNEAFIGGVCDKSTNALYVSFDQLSGPEVGRELAHAVARSFGADNDDPDDDDCSTGYIMVSKVPIGSDEFSPCSLQDMKDDLFDRRCVEQKGWCRVRRNTTATAASTAEHLTTREISASNSTPEADAPTSWQTVFGFAAWGVFSLVLVFFCVYYACRNQNGLKGTLDMIGGLSRGLRETCRPRRLYAMIRNDASSRKPRI